MNVEKNVEKIKQGLKEIIKLGDSVLFGGRNNEMKEEIVKKHPNIKNNVATRVFEDMANSTGKISEAVFYSPKMGYEKLESLRKSGALGSESKYSPQYVYMIFAGAFASVLTTGASATLKVASELLKMEKLLIEKLDKTKEPRKAFLEDEKIIQYFADLINDTLKGINITSEQPVVLEGESNQIVNDIYLTIKELTDKKTADLYIKKVISKLPDLEIATKKEAQEFKKSKEQVNTKTM